MNNQTAVEWFYDKIKSHFEHDGDLLEGLTYIMAIAKAKEREERSEQLKAFADKWNTDNEIADSPIIHDGFIDEFLKSL